MTEFIQVMQQWPLLHSWCYFIAELNLLLVLSGKLKLYFFQKQAYLPQVKNIPIFPNKEEGFKLQMNVFEVTGMKIPQLILNYFTAYQG